MWLRSLVWSPTIALSWLWGLGFFYAIHVTFLYGLQGFLGFALPNALGLGLFGWLVERYGSRTDLRSEVDRIASRYGGILLVYQAVAVAITVSAFAGDFLRPLIGGLAVPLTILLAVVACATGHVLRIQDFKPLHGVMLLVGVAAALAAIVLLPDWSRLQALSPASPRPGAGDARIYGLVVPSLVGFLLGPWLDLQQWQRALRIREEGKSIGRAYAGGGLLFLGLISINAWLAAGLPATAAAVLHPGLDGVVEAQSVVGATFAALGNAARASAWLFGLWAAIAVVSTLDSAYAATRWFLVMATARSNSPIFALLPKPLVQTPLWMLGGAFGIAAIAYGLGIPLVLMVAPFCSLFVGYAACLLLQVTAPRSRLGPAAHHDSMLCFLLGIGAAAAVTVGYYGRMTPVMAVAPLLPLLAAARLRGPASEAAGIGTHADDGTGDRVVARTEAPSRGPAHVVTAEGQAAGTGLAGRFDGNWFLYDVMPSYDDTNSVGNVYFANYIRWVGKTRELFFAKCVPNFDLKTTGFFILTRDFYHKFVRETREFEAILVRIRVGKHNRKFVTLEHEIRNAEGDLLGKGTQQLMFVDVATYALIDVPVDMLRGFLPYVTNAPAGV